MFGNVHAEYDKIAKGVGTLDPVSIYDKPLAGHPNKHIREAIAYAEQRGWTITKASGRAHVYGTLWCSQSGRIGCRFRVYGTPRTRRSCASHSPRR
ncbi:MAG TPA: hypothetical protein PKC18_16215 [Lacipirellulaceae bacterium]|nr:hypothetical protein [Lacipirellulaceae bacterium]